MAIAIIVVRGLRRTGVLGQAASRLLLTVIIFAVAGAALLFLTQNLVDALPKPITGVALAAIGILWLVLLLALLVYGLRNRDQRAQYVALWLFAYAVLLALLAFAASQGATLASIWLMLLAVGFGVLLATLLLFGWGLRAEGEKTAGLVALLLALLVLPLVVALNAVDFEGSDVIEQITGPSVYGLNSGVLIGCAAPAAAPQSMEQLSTREETQREAPAAAPQLDSAGAGDATVVVETVRELAAEQATPAAKSATATESFAETAMQPPAAAAEVPVLEPSLTPQPAVAAEQALALSAAAITTTTPLSPTVTPTATQELTSSLDLAAAVSFTETPEAGVEFASVPITATATAEMRTVEAQLFTTTTPTVTVTLTPTVVGGLASRKALTETATVTPTSTGLNDQAVAAALAAGVTPTARSTTATPTAELVAPTATPAAEPTALITPESTATPENTPMPTLNSTPQPEPAAKIVAATPTPEVRVRQLLRPTSVPLEALPIIRERFPQTLYWNPQTITDATGRAQISIPTGGAITSWRITAQAVDRNGKLGSSTAPLIVFQPLFLVPDVPTELSLGQDASGQVQIFNYGSKPQTVRLVSKTTPGLELSPLEQTVTVGANDVVSIPVRMLALQAGPQTATWIVMGETDQDARQVEITVR